MKHLEQGSSEWVEMRKGYIGASDAPIIMGVSPWMTPVQLWEQKLGFREVKENFAMIRGKNLEHEARLEFEEVTELTVFPEVIFHPKVPWMMASMDGIDIERKNAVEIKCPGEKDHYTALEGKIPEKYYPQLQHQLEVCGLDTMYYFSYRPDCEKKRVLIEIGRNNEYIERMMKEEEIFWNTVQLTPLCQPNLTDKDNIIRHDEEWKNKAEEWKILHGQLENLKLQEISLRKELIDLAGQYNTQGSGVQVTRSIRKGVVMYENIPEISKLDLDIYRKPSTLCWRISMM
jgi:putative phage-type endonuclease